MTEHMLPDSCPPAFRALHGLAAWGMTLLLGCASTQLAMGPNHPANPAAPTAPQRPVGGALDTAFEPLASGSSASATTADPHAGHGKGEHTAPANREPMGEPRNEPVDSGHTPGTKAHVGHEPPNQTAADSKDPQLQWKCPMHPEIIKPEPGNCPICGMKLKQVAPKNGAAGAAQ